MRGFTVDRTGTLTDGALLELTRHCDIAPPTLQEHLDKLFGDAGVSQFGERMLLRGDTQAALIDARLEVLWEYVRRARFPDRPSRYQSVFATPSIDEARAFRARHGDPALHSIWVVEADQGFRADMNLLTEGVSALTLSRLVAAYWSGEAFDSLEPDAWNAAPPAWELLLVPPVRVIERVG